MPKIYGEGADKSFQELLAEHVNSEKADLILSLVDQFKKGEAGAVKIVTNALLETQYDENTKFPITDERFKQIIQMAAEAIGDGEI